MHGRDTAGAFRSLTFTEQVQTVAHDLQASFWEESAIVIANSFGAYLFLHAQMLLPAYIGRVLLLSPIVGEFSNDEWAMGFSPPQPDKLRKMVESGNYSAPQHCEIHVGAQDWQSVPSNVLALANCLSIPVLIVPSTGHILDNGYVSDVLDRWLLVRTESV